MEDNQFVDTVMRAIGAAQVFLDTDRAYGPDDPRPKEEKERLSQTITALTPSNVDVPELHLVVQEAAEEIGVGTVVRTYTRGCEEIGTVVERDGDTLFVAWHGSCVEEELTIGEVDVWADAPRDLRDWRGGVRVRDPAQPERGWAIEPVGRPDPRGPAKGREVGRRWGPSRDRDPYER